MSAPSSDSVVDYTFKTVIVGETAAGKSSILQQFVNGRLNEISKETVGVEFGSRTISVASEDASGSGGSFCTVKLQIWDTAGQEKFRSMTRSYYRGSVGCLLAFALNDRDSFLKLEQWLKEARATAGEELTVVLVGNKADLAAERQVTLLEATKFAQAQGIAAYLETSALSGDNVEAAFFKLARCIVTKAQAGQLTGIVRPAAGAAGARTGGQVAGSANLAAAAAGGGEGAGGCAC